MTDDAKLMATSRSIPEHLREVLVASVQWATRVSPRQSSRRSRQQDSHLTF